MTPTTSRKIRLQCNDRSNIDNCGSDKPEHVDWSTWTVQNIEHLNTCTRHMCESDHVEQHNLHGLIVFRLSIA